MRSSRRRIGIAQQHHETMVLPWRCNAPTMRSGALWFALRVIVVGSHVRRYAERVLLAGRCLLDRVEQPRSRAKELVWLRHRFRDIARTERPSDRQVLVERDMRRQRLAIAAALGKVQACRGCAVRYPWPHGRWDGGYCCGTRTAAVFTDDEIAALHQSGTSAILLDAPTADHAGCVFRGSTGCSLNAGDRPNICHRYLCLELVRELRARGDIRRMDAMCMQLHKTLSEFARLRAADQQAAMMRQLLRTSKRETLRAWFVRARRAAAKLRKLLGSRR